MNGCATASRRSDAKFSLHSGGIKSCIIIAVLGGCRDRLHGLSTLDCLNVTFIPGKLHVAL